MSAITSLTRMILTRNLHPFVFHNEYDMILPYEECERLGLYIHIPFCRSICSFCPYCKTVYQKDLCNAYIDALLKEIAFFGKQGGGKKQVTSLYFGGGSPALAADRLKEILDNVRTYFDIEEGIGIELHPDDVTVDTLALLAEAGVTRLSIGIQSFSPRFAHILGRKEADAETIKAVLDRFAFETVSMDLIFALPGQTADDLKKDIETAFSHGANHIAVYPLIDFTFTPGAIAPMKNKDKRKLLDELTEYCRAKGYARQSIWTFAKEQGACYSSMTRDTFLGFGCSAATLLNHQFKINTFDVKEYISRLSRGLPATSLTLRFTLRQRMVYYLFWQAYSTRVDERDFEHFFGKRLKQQFGPELALAKMLGWITESDGVYEMTLTGAFKYHYYENYYTLAYIDKMWGILRKTAFPEKITL